MTNTQIAREFQLFEYSILQFSSNNYLAVPHSLVTLQHRVANTLIVRGAVGDHAQKIVVAKV